LSVEYAKRASPGRKSWTLTASLVVRTDSLPHPEETSSNGIRPCMIRPQVMLVGKAQRPRRTELGKLVSSALACTSSATTRSHAEDAKQKAFAA
jgi:hypothetical protein